MKCSIRLILMGMLALFSARCGDLREKERDKAAQEDGGRLRDPDGSTEYRYRFRTTYEGLACDTGEHVFATKLDYCRALTDDRLNKRCAQDARKDEFSEQCQDVAVVWPR